MENIENPINDTATIKVLFKEIKDRNLPEFFVSIQKYFKKYKKLSDKQFEALVSYVNMK